MKTAPLPQIKGTVIDTQNDIKLPTPEPHADARLFIHRQTVPVLIVLLYAKQVPQV